MKLEVLQLGQLERILMSKDLHYTSVNNGRKYSVLFKCVHIEYKKFTANLSA